MPKGSPESEFKNDARGIYHGVASGGPRPKSGEISDNFPLHSGKLSADVQAAWKTPCGRPLRHSWAWPPSAAGRGLVQPQQRHGIIAAW